MSEATVFIVDDDEAYRDSLVELVSSVGLPNACFASALDFLVAFDPARAGCLVLDVRMARLSGLELQARLKAMGATLPIVFISGHGDIEMAVKAIKDGAVDFLTKPIDEQVLLDAVEAAFAALDQRNRAEAARAGRDALKAKLTQREREILDLVAEGLSTKEIARALDVSPRTVETHRANIAEKLGAGSVAEMVRFALEG